MVSVLTSLPLLQCKAKRTSNGACFDKPDIIAEFYFGCCSVKQNGHQMVSVLTSPPLLQCKAKRTSNGARFDKPDFCSCSAKENGYQNDASFDEPGIFAEFYFCSCRVKQNRTSNDARFDKPKIIAEFYFCSCSKNQNGHQMVPVLASPTLLLNSTFVVVVYQMAPVLTSQMRSNTYYRCNLSP